jgi:hypothetical protein
MLRLIHTADWQLGKPMVASTATSVLHSARRGSTRLTIGKVAAEHHASYVLVAGGVFDTEGPEDRVIVQAVSRMHGMPASGGCCPGITTLPAIAGFGTGSAPRGPRTSAHAATVILRPNDAQGY